MKACADKCTLGFVLNKIKLYKRKIYVNNVNNGQAPHDVIKLPV